jgi:hypothetical protein
MNVVKFLAEILGIMTKNKLSFCWHVTKKEERRGNMKNKNFMTAEHIRYIATGSWTFQSNVLR